MANKKSLKLPNYVRNGIKFICIAIIKYMES